MDDSSNPIQVRYAEPEDQPLLIEWLLQPGVLQWFPLNDVKEVEDAVRLWMGYMKHQAVLTAMYDGVPCGNAVLYIQPYPKLAHQSLFAIIIDEKYRGRGVGTRLIEELIRLGQEQFHLELIHLEVYEGNPAIHLYRKMGFTEYGVHPHFVKQEGHYLSKILMQKTLVLPNQTSDPSVKGGS